MTDGNPAHALAVGTGGARSLLLQAREKSPAFLRILAVSGNRAYNLTVIRDPLGHGPAPPAGDLRYCQQDT